MLFRSKQGGFEIYVEKTDSGLKLYDHLFEIGKEFNVRPGCPNLIERIESGLLSYGNDFDNNDNPFQCGFDKYVDLETDINFLGKDKLKKIKEKANEKNVQTVKRGRKSKFKSLIIEKDFEPENPKQLEELDENSCKWPIGHPDEKSFYFCGRSSLKDFSYCKLHLLYAYQPKGKKEEVSDKEEVPEFIEKKIQSA